MASTGTSLRMLLILAAALQSVLAAKELPSFVPICSRSDPQLAECIRKATVTLQPYIARGIPELNIPSVSPLNIPMVKLEQGTGAVNYKLKLTNLKIYGLGEYKFQQVRFIEKDLKIDGNVDIPDLYLESDYVIDGRALVVPIRGEGIFTANLTNTKASVDIQLNLVKRKNGEYIRPTETRVSLTIGGAKAHFGNLFNGDPILSRTTNTFLNENTKDILEEVKPAVEAVAAMIVEDVASNVVRVVPYNRLLPTKL
ncbi:protein takeout-like [Frankliniella occidentalis]|uniref:Protein takeout-like n=1 Tax=Frankliniella occidentalis TaxID=133901 RepID=A0A6J1SGZ9_FRAOC|nr:protein takeout-like [Frankliniella occidentalis]